MAFSLCVPGHTLQLTDSMHAMLSVWGLNLDLKKQNRTQALYTAKHQTCPVLDGMLRLRITNKGEVISQCHM